MKIKSTFNGMTFFVVFVLVATLFIGPSGQCRVINEPINPRPPVIKA